MLSRRFGAEQAIAPVQVNLKDALFVHPEIKHVGDDQFLTPTQLTALTRQEKILRQLLGNGGTAAYHLALFLILFVGFLQRIPVHPAMLGEIGVFGGDDRAFQVARDTRIRHPFELQLSVRDNLGQLEETFSHEADGAWIMIYPPPYLDEKNRLVTTRLRQSAACINAILFCPLISFSFPA